MKLFRRYLYRHLHHLVPLPILAAAFIGWLAEPAMLAQFRLNVFDEYIRLRPRQYAPTPVRIIDIDDDSLQRFGQWPWPRTLLAQLVDRLNEMGAAVIASDLLFIDPDRTTPSRIIEHTKDIAPDDPLVARFKAMPDHDQVFADAIKRLGLPAIEASYGNLFDMYERITAENPYEVPMRIYPAIHYTMGGLWVDYDLQSTIPGLFVIGEANFSDHGANRLGASALMQGLADGYFVLPSTINDYIARGGFDDVAADNPVVTQVESEVTERLERLLSNNGDRTVDSFHRELGTLMWEYCGMARSESGLRKALERIPELRREFWRSVKVPGTGEELNQELEKANRVADFLEFGELLLLDARAREESCGGHFREEHQTSEGEAKRDDEHFSYVAAWEYRGDGKSPVLHKENLDFTYVHPTQRSYT